MVAQAPEPPPVYAAPPVISGLRVSPSPFAAGQPATVRFRLSSPAEVALTVDVGEPERFALEAGPRQLPLPGVGLPPGRYPVALVAKDAFNQSSAPVRRVFTVLTRADLRTYKRCTTTLARGLPSGLEAELERFCLITTRPAAKRFCTKAVRASVPKRVRPKVIRRGIAACRNALRDY